MRVYIFDILQKKYFQTKLAYTLTFTGSELTSQGTTDISSRASMPSAAEKRELLKGLSTLSGGEVLNRILDSENPKETVQSLSSGDFFWLVKKIGADECLPLLELASTDQWQHLLDLEIWRRDRLDIEDICLWMKRLESADPGRLVTWLFSQGQALAYYHFLKITEVIVAESEDDSLDLPEDFFSIDGVIHIRVLNPEYRESTENLIRSMADQDFLRYQAVFLRLGGFLPVETEEEMYRVRNIRLAEHGFLPFEEALRVYSPLNPEDIKREKPLELPEPVQDDRLIIPASPLYHAGTQNMLTETLSRATDPLLMERLRLEFAGLCNQILSADGLMNPELNDLVRTCRKGASYISLALERLCGRDAPAALGIIREHSLISLFRVGFGLALKIKWEAERWLSGSWFHNLGLQLGFWGEDWGGAVAGILQRTPRLFMGVGGDEEYKDFEWLSELGEGLMVLRRVMVLDSLMDKLTETFPLNDEIMQAPEATFTPLLFNFWAHELLNLKPGFSPLSRDQAAGLFTKLRSKDKGPPFTMAGFEKAFIRCFMAFSSSSDTEASLILEETLGLIWNQFREEYQGISTEDLEPRYSEYILIAQSPEDDVAKGRKA
jgi:uncharacterized protein DUF6178